MHQFFMKIILHVVFAFLVGIKAVQSQMVYPQIIVLYDSVWIYKNLALVPIKLKDSFSVSIQKQSKVLTLEQAIQQKKIKITENNFEGRENVNTLNVKNVSKETIFIANGELLKGGKQDRMIAESKLLYPNMATEFLTVFCIEKGRWDKRPKKFNYAGNANFGLQYIADSTHTQQQVWREIEKQLKQTNTVTTTEAYLQMSDSNYLLKQDYFKFFVNKLQQSDSSYVGFIAITNNEILACEVFATTQLNNAVYNRTLYKFISAVKQPANEVVYNKKEVENFANDIFSSEIQQKKFLEHHGKIFYYNNVPVHIIAYPKK